VWTGFQFGTAPSAVTPSYTVNTLNPFLLRITDGCKIGDHFRLDWTGTSSGSLFTSNATANDGFETGCTTGVACWLTAGLSKGHRPARSWALASWRCWASRNVAAPEHIGGRSFLICAPFISENVSAHALRSCLNVRATTTVVSGEILTTLRGN